jgi:oligoendopeptidase F
MSTVKSLPKRSRVKLADTWNLSSLFKNDAEWEAEFSKWEKQKNTRKTEKRRDRKSKRLDNGEHHTRENHYE